MLDRENKMGDTKKEEQHLTVGDSRATVTFVDRHTCKREVPMKVLCFGLGRTGTNSLRHALFQLGYRDVYHFSSLFENPPDMDMWIEALEAKHGRNRSWTDRDWDRLMGKHKTDAAIWGRNQFDQQLGHCMAVTDNPCWHFVPELLEAYPEAKVVLTVRDPGAWYRSWNDTLYHYMRRNYLPAGVLLSLRRWLWNPSWPLYSQTLLDRMNEAACRNQPWLEFPYHGLEWYEGHNEWVRTLAKEQNRDFLEFDARQGWEPLCEFLGEEVPDKRQFPRLNDSKQFFEIFGGIEVVQDKLALRNIMILNTAVVGVGAIIAAYWRTMK